MEILWSPGNSDPLGAGKTATTLSSSLLVSLRMVEFLGKTWNSLNFFETMELLDFFELIVH